jgi:hypothetical protein
MVGSMATIIMYFIAVSLFISFAGPPLGDRLRSDDERARAGSTSPGCHTLAGIGEEDVRGH